MIGICDIFLDFFFAGSAGRVAKRPIMEKLLCRSKAVLQRKAGILQRFDTKLSHQIGNTLCQLFRQLHGIGQLGGEAMEYENIIFLPSMLMSAESDLCTYDFLRPMTEGGIGKPLHITGGLPDYGAFMECIGILDQL